MSADLEARQVALEARQTALEDLLRGLAKPPLPAPLLFALVAIRADVSKDADHTLLPWREPFQTSNETTRLVLRAVSGLSKAPADSAYDLFRIYRDANDIAANKGFTLNIDRGGAQIRLAPETSLDEVKQLGILIARTMGYRVLSEEEVVDLLPIPATTP